MKLKFSDRIGVTQPSQALQINILSEALKNSLWNFIYKTVFGIEARHFVKSIKFICEHYYKEQIDKLPNNNYDYITWLKDKFYSATAKWYEIYNLFEFMVDYWNQLHPFVSRKDFIEGINFILERENSGYRFVSGELVPITNESEIKSISDSIELAKQNRLFGAATHFESALEFLSLKPEPDFRNTIKESISAVESVVKQITNEKGGGLDKALAILDAKLKFHRAFQSVY